MQNRLEYVFLKKKKKARPNFDHFMYTDNFEKCTKATDMKISGYCEGGGCIIRLSVAVDSLFHV